MLNLFTISLIIMPILFTSFNRFGGDSLKSIRKYIDRVFSTYLYNYLCDKLRI